MTDNKFEIVCKVKSSKIKSKIEGYIETNYPDMEFGQEDFIIKVHLDFDPEDVPSKIKVICTTPEGFEDIDAFDLKPDGKALDFELKVTYLSSEVGYYTVEGRLEHDEYGTELGKLEASYFYLKVPELKIKSCTAEPAIVKRGDKLDLNLILYSSAPQKIKGVLTGKLKPVEGSSATKIYELEPQKLGVRGERPVSWPIRIPKDEENIGDYYAEFNFDSKETKMDARFDNLFKLKRLRDIQLIELDSESHIFSEADTVKIKSMIKNIGIEEVKINLSLVIDSPDGSSITLPPKKIKLKPEASRKSSWKWKVPEDAVHGHYQLGLSWTFLTADEKGDMPGNTFEVKPHHILEFLSITTDKDYYLSGQNVRFIISLLDNGTRAAKSPLNVQYYIVTSKGLELFSGTTEKKIGSDTTDVSFEWPIPKDMSTGAFDLKLTILSKDKELASKNASKLVNVEQPVLLRFDIPRMAKLKPTKRYKKYILEGEKIVSEHNYHKLKIYELSSDTRLLQFENKIFGGIGWNNLNRSQIRNAEDLFFSYLMLNYGLNTDKLDKFRAYWYELGFIWTSKLTNIAKNLQVSNKANQNQNSIYEDAFSFKQILLKSKAFERLKRNLSAGDVNYNNWMQFVEPLIAPVRFAEYTNIKKVFNLTRYDKYGKSVLGVMMEYLESGTVKESGKLSSAMNNLIKVLYAKVSVSSPKADISITKAAERFYSYLKNARLEIEPDNQKSTLLDLVYCISMLKLITRIINIIDSIKSENKIIRKQYVQLSSALIGYNVLNIEYLQNNIRYNQFMDEKLSTKELAAQFNLVEQTCEELELIISNVMQLYRNQHENMKLRLHSALLNSGIKLNKESEILNGLSGEQLDHKLYFENKSSAKLECNVLLAFPSTDWHLLEPETNNIDNVYWHENVIIPPNGSYLEKIKITFPKSLSLKDYNCLIKLEPRSIRLLNEI